MAAQNTINLWVLSTRASVIERPGRTKHHKSWGPEDSRVGHTKHCKSWGTEQAGLVIPGVLSMLTAPKHYKPWGTEHLGRTKTLTLYTQTHPGELGTPMSAAQNTINPGVRSTVA